MAGVKFPLPAAGGGRGRPREKRISLSHPDSLTERERVTRRGGDVTATAKPEARLTGSTGYSPDTRHDARPDSLAHAGRTLIVRAGLPLVFSARGADSICSRGKFKTLPLSAHNAATSVTTFILRDMADSRRFVMTSCYDLAVFGA